VAPQKEILLVKRCRVKFFCTYFKISLKLNELSVARMGVKEKDDVGVTSSGKL